MNWRDLVKRRLRSVFEAGQRFGVDVLPRHFYSEIPDIRQLRAEASWRRPFTMIGIPGISVSEQLEFLAWCCTPEVTDRFTRRHVHAEACREVGHEGYGPVEADVLYAFMYRKRPSHVFQIGCGVSTAIMLMAARDAGYVPKIQCVEPNPSEYLRAREREGALTLIVSKAQSLDHAMIDALPTDVLFFVDSSHTLGPAGEVSRIVLEFLPRLKGGAWIHFHDIYFPYDYDRHLLTRSVFFQHESALLHAYLVQNASVRVCASLSMLHYGAALELQRLVPRYRPAPNGEGLETGSGHFPSSTYLRVVAGS